jgi:exosortase
MMEASVSRDRVGSEGLLKRHWPILVGFLALALPTLLSLAQQEWSRERGVHEPLVIVTGAWLIWREFQTLHLRPQRGDPAVTAAILLPALLAYAFGRSFDFLILEAAGLYAAGLACAYEVLGGAILKRLWFPLFYLLFALPAPGWLLDFATAPLKELASTLTTHLLQMFGVPIVREGVTLFVAQYQLLVEDACAGMNAILGLTALGLFYAYLQHGASWRFCAALAVVIIPIAVLANVVRIIILVLITWWFGNEAAQGYLHGMAGLVTFATGLFLVFLVDAGLSRLRLFRESEA